MMKDEASWTAHFRGINTRFSRLYTQLLARLNLTLPQYTVLGLLEEWGMVPMTEISDKLLISKPAVTHLVDRLEDKKFLRRVPHVKDRRISLLQIRPKGRRVVRRTQGAVLMLLMETLKTFAPNDRKKIGRFYSALADNMDRTLLKLKGRES
jgi:DNA-binding MarR family transcriptional regulator